jgi:hypothetical protein
MTDQPDKPLDKQNIPGAAPAEPPKTSDAPKPAAQSQPGPEPSRTDSKPTEPSSAPKPASEQPAASPAIPPTEQPAASAAKPAPAPSVDGKTNGESQIPGSTRDLRDYVSKLDKDDTVPPSTVPPVAKPSEPKPAATSSGPVCPSCGHRNRPGSLICDNCGTNLMTGRQPIVGTRDLVREQEARKEDKILDTSETKAVESAGSSTFTDDMVLRVEVEGGTTPMLVYPKQEIILGRRDPTTGGMPDVDLTAYAGYRMGVSRRHAAIRLQDKHLHLSDLGSSNGTFINGTRLSAHRPYQLRDGDEIRLGQMVMKVFFQNSKDRK